MFVLKFLDFGVNGITIAELEAKINLQDTRISHNENEIGMMKQTIEEKQQEIQALKVVLKSEILT